MPLLIDPQTGEPVLSVQPFDDGGRFRALPCYSMALITKGQGTVVADVSTFAFSAGSLLSFAIYQPFKISGSMGGVWISFHPSFFCLHKHRNEVSCNGVLFNNVYDSPVLSLKPGEMRSLSVIIEEMTTELQGPALTEVLISYLKIFLINASRAKRRTLETPTVKTPSILETLKETLELHFKTLHSPAGYAELLHISPKALNKITKTHFNKTLSAMISERIIIEAKRELYLSTKAVKQIAYELGFSDEFYFSRFFKNNVAVSPQGFRDTVGSGKGMYRL